MLSTIEWTPTGEEPSKAGLPYATHWGVLEIGDAQLRCYRLSTGVAVFNADDVEDFFGGFVELPPEKS